MQSTEYRFESILKYLDKSPITYHPTVGREHDSLDLYYASLLKVGVITYDGDKNFNAKTYDAKLTINKLSTTVTGTVNDITYS